MCVCVCGGGGARERERLDMQLPSNLLTLVCDNSLFGVAMFSLILYTDSSSPGLDERGGPAGAGLGSLIFPPLGIEYRPQD